MCLVRPIRSECDLAWQGVATPGVHARDRTKRVYCDQFGSMDRHNLCEAKTHIANNLSCFKVLENITQKEQSLQYLPSLTCCRFYFSNWRTPLTARPIWQAMSSTLNMSLKKRAGLNNDKLHNLASGASAPHASGASSSNASISDERWDVREGN